MDQGKRYINYSPDVVVVAPRYWVEFWETPYATQLAQYMHMNQLPETQIGLEFKVVRNESLQGLSSFTNCLHNVTNRIFHLLSTFKPWNKAFKPPTPTDP